MTTIWKFPLEITGIQVLQIPRVWRFLSVQAQRDKPQLWVLVDESAPKESWRIITVGTGHRVPESVLQPEQYVGTYQTHDGNFVGHVFVERGEA